VENSDDVLLLDDTLLEEEDNLSELELDELYLDSLLLLLKDDDEDVDGNARTNSAELELDDFDKLLLLEIKLLVDDESEFDEEKLDEEELED